VPRALVGLMFFPRGGSSHVVRALATALPAEGWDVTVVCGHREGHGDARRFFAGLDVRPVDFTAALASGEPMRADPPMHPSYEDRPGAPDRVFASLDDELYERQVAAWSQALEAAGAAEADVLYLHHLTPLNEAAVRVAPGTPVVSHLHGTELLMLEEIDDGAPAEWAHADAWAERMRQWAGRSRAVITQSESQVQRAAEALGIDAERCTVVPNGFDPESFHPCELDRRALWQRHLVEEPQGWAPDREPGSVSYTVKDVERITDEPVLLYVGRFTAVKRIGLLVRAFARVQQADGNRAALVLLGGHPGEWEGEHPLEAVEASGARDVFLAGWHDHDALPGFLNAVDAIVLPSVREQFGQVLVEGMACGLPAVAVNRHGPAGIVEDGHTGWLVEPDDEAGLAAALAEVIADPPERSRRGEAAREAAVARYAWPSLAGRVSETLRSAVIEAQH
jgi:glycosyltransferase involved in cell wall biosynthesis